MVDIPCPFCELKGKQFVLLQTDEWTCTVDHNPVSPGHMILFPRRHVQNLVGLTQEEWAYLKNVITEVIERVQKIDLVEVYKSFIAEIDDEKTRWFCEQALNHPGINTKPDAYNHGVNDGRAAGRTVDHLHWHVIPRYEGDMEDPRGGVRYVIPEMGNYKISRI